MNQETDSQGKRTNSKLQLLQTHAKGIHVQHSVDCQTSLSQHSRQWENLDLTISYTYCESCWPYRWHIFKSEINIYKHFNKVLKTLLSLAKGIQLLRYVVVV